MHLPVTKRAQKGGEPQTPARRCLSQGTRRQGRWLAMGHDCSRLLRVGHGCGTQPGRGRVLVISFCPWDRAEAGCCTQRGVNWDCTTKTSSLVISGGPSAAAWGLVVQTGTGLSGQHPSCCSYSAREHSLTLFWHQPRPRSPEVPVTPSPPSVPPSLAFRGCCRSPKHFNALTAVRLPWQSLQEVLRHPDALPPPPRALTSPRCRCRRGSLWPQHH